MSVADDVLELSQELRALDWGGGKPDDPLRDAKRQRLVEQLAPVVEEGFLALTQPQREALREDVGRLLLEQDAALLEHCTVPTMPRELPDAQVEGWITAMHALCVYAGAREEAAKAVLARARRLHGDWERLWQAISSPFVAHKWKTQSVLTLMLRQDRELLARLEEHAERWGMRAQRLREAYDKLSRILTAKQGAHGVLRRHYQEPQGTVPWGGE